MFRRQVLFRFTLQQALVSVILCLLFVSCDRLFEYSPYDSRVPDNCTNTTTKQLALLAASDTGIKDTFRVALLSDSHHHYDDLADAVREINRRNDISFILLLGDITEQGLQSEYMFLYEVMAKSRIPYLTLIGNHDYLSNGEYVYDQMFGAKNYSFTYGNTRFIMFDDVFWESNTVPDFNWLNSQLATQDTAQDMRTVLCAHIPPFADQFTANYENIFRAAVKSHDVMLTVHGHRHHYDYTMPYNDGKHYLVVPSPDRREYCDLMITPAGAVISRIAF